MRWTPGGSRENLEDRRGQRGGGGGFGLPIGRLGIGGFLVLLVLSFLFKVDLFSLLGGGGAAPVATQAPASSNPQEEQMVEFVNFINNDTQKVWSEQFSASGQSYQPERRRAAATAVYRVESNAIVDVERYVHDGERFVPESGGAWHSGR